MGYHVRVAVCLAVVGAALTPQSADAGWRRRSGGCVTVSHPCVPPPSRWAPCAAPLLTTPSAAPGPGGGSRPPGPQTEAAPAANSPEEALKIFLSALSKGETRRAYDLVAPTTKSGGDPITDRAKADFDSFAAEVKARPADKFAKYELGERREEGAGRVRIVVRLADGDTDETLLVREGGWWYVADPIHIIR